MSESYFQLVSPSGLRPILFASPRSNYMYIVAHIHTLARDVLYIPTDPSLFLFRFFFFLYLEAESRTKVRKRVNVKFNTRLTDDRSVKFPSETFKQRIL